MCKALYSVTLLPIVEVICWEVNIISSTAGNSLVAGMTVFGISANNRLHNIMRPHSKKIKMQNINEKYCQNIVSEKERCELLTDFQHSWLIDCLIDL